MAAPDAIVQVRGARELRRQLKQAGDDLTDMKTAHKRAAEIAATGAEALVPMKSRDLRDSIRAAGTKTAGIVRAGKKSVPYANAIQWGRKVWPAKRASPQPPRHKFFAVIKPSLFATEGAKATEPKWVAEYEKSLDKALDKIKGDAQ
ncbi:hypothetical protein [Schaalia vaccimaxillae]|uniref:hypothetical protein n=1 Tax=Schaalia vaccimaxillae TaxID=183916 RepID=UPI0003B60286|nr:hypothetical protein [Schaalia vaccimaxillae]